LIYFKKKNLHIKTRVLLYAKVLSQLLTAKKMGKNFYHNRFWDWVSKIHNRFGNWLWAKRWRNFKK